MGWFKEEKNKKMTDKEFIGFLDNRIRFEEAIKSFYLDLIKRGMDEETAIGMVIKYFT